MKRLILVIAAIVVATQAAKGDWFDRDCHKKSQCHKMTVKHIMPKLSEVAGGGCQWNICHVKSAQNKMVKGMFLKREIYIMQSCGKGYKLCEIDVEIKPQGGKLVSTWNKLKCKNANMAEAMAEMKNQHKGHNHK